MKTNPSTAKRAERKVHVFTIVGDSGVPYTFHLRARNTAEDFQSESLKAAMIRRYIKGDGKEEPMAFPPLADGTYVPVSEDLFDYAAGIYCMQPAELDPDDRYSPEDFAQLPVADDSVFVALIRKSGVINKPPKAASVTDGPKSTASDSATKKNSRR